MGTSNLLAFRTLLGKVREDKDAEGFVRTMVSKVATNCPLDLLEHLANCVVDQRRAELQRDAERN